MKARNRRSRLARTAIVVLCGLALLGTPLGVRADDVPLADNGGGEEVVWSWTKFFDYVGCAAAIAVTIGDAGATVIPTTIMCARAVVIHFTD